VISFRSANGGLKQSLLRRRQAIDASGEHGVNSGGDCDGAERVGQMVGTPSPIECMSLGKGADALLHKQRIAARLLHQQPLQGIEPGIGPEQRLQEFIRPFGDQRIDAELSVAALAGPVMAVLGAVVDEQDDSRRRQALDKAVEKGLSLGVDPVQVLGNDQERLELALADLHALDGFERALSPVTRVERRKGAVCGQSVEQSQDGRNGVCYHPAAVQHFCRDFLPRRLSIVTVADLEQAS